MHQSIELRREHEYVWTYDRLKQCLVHAEQDGRRGMVSYRSLPRHVERGAHERSLGHKALRCAELTQADDEKAEYGINIIVAGDRVRTTAMQKAVRGTEYGVSIAVHETYPSVGMIHSHPNDSSFSAEDILQVLRSTPYIHLQLSMLGTASGHLRLLLPTTETPVVRTEGEWSYMHMYLHRLLRDVVHRSMPAYDQAVAFIAQQLKCGYYGSTRVSTLQRIG